MFKRFIDILSVLIAHHRRFILNLMIKFLSLQSLKTFTLIFPPKENKNKKNYTILSNVFLVIHNL